MTMPRRKNALRGLLAGLLAVIAGFAVLVAVSQPTARENVPCEASPVAHDTALPREIDPAQDLQMPELPTGCEATALSTMLRLNGVQVTKTEVADAMPKSGTDFVHSFLGDPYAENGGCCMAPCSAETARTFLVGAGLMAYETEGRDLSTLPLPCVVWTTIDLEQPQGPIKTQGAYSMFYPSHCVTVTGITGDTVKTIDPLKGFADYPFDKFEDVYEQMGAQAVYIGRE